MKEIGAPVVQTAALAAILQCIAPSALFPAPGFRYAGGASTGQRRQVMTTLAFDTLKAVKPLRAAGFGDSQAEAVTEQINAAVGENLATKDDVRTLRTDVENALEKLELRMTIKLYGAVAGGAGLIKVLDFLIG